MDAKYINPFIQSAISMIKTLSNIDFEKGKLTLQNGQDLINGIGAIIRIRSNFLSEVIYDFSEVLAIKITENMNGTTKDDTGKTEFDIMFEDTILELSNLISGRAITLLSNENIDANVTPPELVRGIGANIVPNEQKVIVLPLSSKFGELLINVAITT